MSEKRLCVRMGNRIMSFPKINRIEESFLHSTPGAKRIPEMVEYTSAFNEALLVNRGEGCNEIL